jgi:uncharacterized membrane protein
MSSPYPWKALFGDEKRTHNVNELFDSERTVGERASDTVAATMGSWRFIIIQSVILACWIVLNAVAWVRHWDPYPFILMNLVLSMQAAYAAPIIMMSQNRQAARDRLEAHNDFLTDCKAEEEVRGIMDHLEAQDHMLREILVRLDAMNVTELEMPRLLAEAEAGEKAGRSVDAKPSAAGGATP